MSDALVQLTDTSDMIQLHKVFRQAFGGAAQLVGAASTDDPEQLERVATFYENVLALLQVHHEGEDELVWPKLIERAPEDAAAVARIAGQHDGVTASIAECRARIAIWRAAPDVEAGARLAAGLATLGADLVEHLDEEERVVLPLAARHMTPAEWAELPPHGFQHFTGDKVWLILGLIQEQMTPEQIETMQAHMPPPVVEFWTGTGRPLFLDFVGALRG